MSIKLVARGRWVKKAQKLVHMVYERPLRWKLAFAISYFFRDNDFGISPKLYKITRIILDFFTDCCWGNPIEVTQGPTSITKFFFFFEKKRIFFNHFPNIDIWAKQIVIFLLIIFFVLPFARIIQHSVFPSKLFITSSTKSRSSTQHTVFRLESNLVIGTTIPGNSQWTKMGKIVQ